MQLWPKTHRFDILWNVTTASEDQTERSAMSLSADELRQKVFDELEALGMEYSEGRLIPQSDDKEFQRLIHNPAREIELQKANRWLKKAWPRYKNYLANGDEIHPEEIRPKLVEAITGQQKNIFRLVRYTWSLPYTKGFGRRLQFLIIDESNQKLIGILGMQSPPLSFPARDNLFDYPTGRKTALINQTMDIYTLGAVPPYARLLGGKLVALVAASNEIRAAYRRKYDGIKTEMEGRYLPADLIALTTTSAYGRSSIYNRLVYQNRLIAQPIGFTEGYGAFHFERLYPSFRQFLEEQGINTKGGYGTGPRIKWQVIVRALNRLGFSNELLRHGVLREVFMYPLISNLAEYIIGMDGDPKFLDLPFENLVDFWRERWLLPRSVRVNGWHAWDRETLFEALFPHRTV